MGRIEFDGEGAPIPALALPPFGSDSDLPPTTLTFTENTDFLVSDYRTLGFTHYEVWCVGAAGGRGGGTTSPYFMDLTETVKNSVPQSIWNLIRERANYEDYFGQKFDLEDRPDLHGYVSSINLIYKPGVHQGLPGTAGWHTDPGKLGLPYDHGGPTMFRWSKLMQDNLMPGEAGGVPYVGVLVGPLKYGYKKVTLMTYIWLDTTAAGDPGFNWWPDLPYRNYEGTFLQMFDLNYANQVNRLVDYRTLKDAAIVPISDQLGGAGGGGGFYKSAGVLADLPDSIPIGVGKVGLDGAYGHTKQLGIYTPTLDEIADWYYPINALPSAGTSGETFYRRRIFEIDKYMQDYLASYPTPHKTFDNPKPGQDGGASYFGDVGKASGGKGGGSGAVWDPATSQFVRRGFGGDGGLGGTLIAGGGGAGSTLDTVNGSDGGWNPETGIGGGGGGGKAGKPPAILPSAGGQGSYSFGDTTVYGTRQFRQTWTRLSPNIVGGAIVFSPVTDSNTYMPGAGGGARPFPNLKYGGRGVGYSPDGIVVLRLTKIT